MEKYCITCKYFSPMNGVARDNKRYIESQRPRCKKKSKNNRYISVEKVSSCDKWTALERRVSK